MEGACCVCREVTNSAHSPCCKRSRAVNTYFQKRTGSLSCSSSETQATWAVSFGSACTHDESRVVLPKPAGAETRVREHWNPLSNSVESRGRTTRTCDETGTKNLVASSSSARGSSNTSSG